MEEQEIRNLKNNSELRLLAIDGKYYSINLLGKNKIITRKEFESLKSQYSWTTDF